jgi:predicted  nucleic acid-binding Zn-ribbon protein
MERPTGPEDHDLVRCLDCGTVYDLPRSLQDAAPCPECGAVGWMAVTKLRASEQEGRGAPHPRSDEDHRPRRSA